MSQTYTVRMRRKRMVTRYEHRDIAIVLDEDRLKAFRERNHIDPDEPIDEDLLVELAEGIDDDDLTAEWEEHLTERTDLDLDDIEIEIKEETA